MIDPILDRVKGEIQMKKVDSVHVHEGNGFTVVTERFEPSPPPGQYEICIWPDGTWVLRDEYNEEDWRWYGDDFRIVRVPTALEEDDINRLIEQGKL